MIRIARLDLERWGHFDGHRLPFGPAGNLHVLYGPNEAGKSTTRRAIGALLFGVPERTTDTYGRPGSDLRIGALLEIDGVATEVVRRKGRKATLLDADGQPLDPSPLERALGGLGADVFGGLFEITHDSLVEGGHELLTGRGAVGEALFAAAAGTSRLQALLRHLEGEAEELFSTRPSKRPLNVRLARHAEALRALRDAGLRPPEHEARRRELEALEHAYAEAGAALEATERGRARIERLRGALPLAALRATRAQELAELAEVPVLAADAAARRTAAQARRERARASAAAAERELARRRARLEALAVDEGLLAFATQIDELHATGAAVAQDAARRDDLAAQRTTLSAHLEELLRGLAPALGERSLHDVALDADARSRLEACLQARAGVAHAAQAAHDAEAAARRAAERAAQEADAAPAAAADGTVLGAALRAARAAGAVDEQAARACAEEERARRLADQAVAQMVPAPADAAALARLPVPPRETVEELLAAVVEAHRVADALEREDDDLAEQRAAAERQRERLAGTDAPALDPAALAQARADRDTAWEAVRAALGTPLDANRAAELVAAHERAVAAADAVADTRLQRAEDVARLADLERQLALLAREGEELAQRRARHASAVARAATRWSAAWEPAGAVAPSPAQAGAWLAGRDTALAHLADADAAAERAAAATALRDQHATALRAALDYEAGGPAAGDVPLATLIELADARVEALRGDAERATRAAEEAARTAAALEDAEAAREQAETRLARWQDEWAGLRSGCGLADALAPDDALAALRGLEQAARDHEHLDGLGAEIATIDGRRTAFETAVAQVVAAAAPDLASQAAGAAVAVLHRRATQTRAAADERDAVEAEVASLDAEHAEAVAAIEAADDELAALRAAAGVEDDATLGQREQESARAEELRVEIAGLDGDLARAGGAPADEVAAAVAELDADTLPARADELKVQAARERDARDEAGRELTRARDELGRLERSEEAARAAQEAASLEAEVRELAERYARARLAQRVLRDAIARYRSAHEGPLLARANVLFPALTCERFARLETDVDDRDEDILVAVTADGSRRRVEELSDGTREQLFLALRLAAIERHVATAEAVPVVFDDVLLESDDARAARILAALSSLAEHTQVLVLTHHRHLVELARDAVPAARLDVIDLRAGAAADAADADDAATAQVDADAERLVLDEDDPAPEASAAPTLADELEAALAGPSAPPRDEQQRLL